MERVDISVVLPVYNEEDNIDPAYTEVKAALAQLERNYEIIFVNDGSRDASYQRLVEIAAHDPAVKVISFRRNFGQTAAMDAGIQASQGEVIILMDADLQNDPRDIGALLEKLDEGYDIVSGWRKDRQDANLQRKLPSKIANGLISKVTGVALHDYGCTLKAYRRDVLQSMRLYGEMHRFIPAYAALHGARVTEIPVNHRPRIYGVSKYGISRTVRVLIDLLTVKFMSKYATRPSHFISSFGMLILLASFLTFLLAGGEDIIERVSLLGNAMTLLSVVLFVLAVQTLLIGLVAEMVMRTYYEAQDKRPYVIRSIINGATPNTIPADITVPLHQATKDDINWYIPAPTPDVAVVAETNGHAISS